MTETWNAPIGPPWSAGELKPERDGEHREQEVSEANIKIALENFDAALQYFHEHAMEEFDLDYQPKIPGDYGAYESGGELIQMRVRQAVDDLSEVTPELVRQVIAANAPPLPEPDTVPGLLEWAVTHVRARMIWNAFHLIDSWFAECCADIDTPRLIGVPLVEIAKRHLYEIDAPLADSLIDVVAYRTDDATRQSFFEWIRNDERSVQWMIWRIDDVYWYDEDDKIHYGPRPEIKGN